MRGGGDLLLGSYYQMLNYFPNNRHLHIAPWSNIGQVRAHFTANVQICSLNPIEHDVVLMFGQRRRRWAIMLKYHVKVSC